MEYLTDKFLISENRRKKKERRKKKIKERNSKRRNIRKVATSFRVISIDAVWGAGSYKEYIISKDWKKKKKELIKVWSCKICGRTDKRNLNVHHLTYKNLYREKREDLMVLCQPCHILWHTTKKPTVQKLKNILWADKIENEMNKRYEYLVNKG